MRHAKKIQYRRDKVSEYLVLGVGQNDMAAALNVSQATISKDVAYLEIRAREELKHHIDKKMPHVHLQVMQGIERVIRTGWALVNSGKNDYVKIHALNLIHSAYITKSNLSTGTAVVQDSLMLLNKSKEELERIVANDKAKDSNSNEIPQPQSPSPSPTHRTLTGKVF